jgi:hypothetical protein
MTEQTGSQPPDWYRNPPDWLREPPARRDRYRDDDDDRDYRSGRRSRESDTIRDLEQRIAGMPEAVVNALKEAIQGATQQRQSEQQQRPPEQQQQQNSSSENSNKDGSGGDDKPGEQLTWGEKFLMNKL